MKAPCSDVMSWQGFLVYDHMSILMLTSLSSATFT